jgi:nucleotide-binding universal stress UspA family protein
LATDFLQPSRRAFVYALKLAAARHAHLLIVHVLKTALDGAPLARTSNRRLNAMKTAALLELGRMARAAQDKGVAAQPCLLHGSPTASILEKAHDVRAELIVMGTHGRTGWDRLQLGSTAEAVLRGAPCPVMTVRGVIAGDPSPSSLGAIHRLMVATDFSSHAAQALSFAVPLALALKARVLLVHAQTPPAHRSAGRTNVPGEPGMSNGSGTSPRRLLERLLSSLKEKGIPADAFCGTGDPVSVILAEARRWNADLLVIGTRGRRGLSRFILGSVAEQLIRRAGCPVLVVKGAGRSARPV